MAKSPEEMLATMVANMKEKTGKTLAQWVKIAKGSKLEKHGQIVKFLKSDHGMTHGFANLVAAESLGSISHPADGGGGDDLVAGQYAGDKAKLKPIYDAVVKAVKAFGQDVEIAPKKAYVSLRRNKQFAIVQPSTKTRVDIGINLKGTPPTKRLEASGSFNSMVSHRVRIAEAKEIDAELINWLRAAYEAS